MSGQSKFVQPLPESELPTLSYAARKALAKKMAYDAYFLGVRDARGLYEVAYGLPKEFPNDVSGGIYGVHGDTRGKLLSRSNIVVAVMQLIDGIDGEDAEYLREILASLA